MNAKAIIIGSPTVNNTLFHSTSSFLTHILGLKPKNKIWAIFGSYGWGGGAVRNIKKLVSNSGFSVLEPQLTVKFSPNEEELKKCREFGEKIGKTLNENIEV
jgi:flavorubredoxin